MQIYVADQTTGSTVLQLSRTDLTYTLLLLRFTFLQKSNGE